MTKENAAVKASTIKFWLSLSKGFKEGQHGYFYSNDGKADKDEYRFKVGKNSLRFETKTKTDKKWSLISSGYFKDINILDGKLDGMTIY